MGSTARKLFQKERVWKVDWVKKTRWREIEVETHVEIAPKGGVPWDILPTHALLESGDFGNRRTGDHDERCISGAEMAEVRDVIGDKRTS
jgi:hypothetical protein